MITAALYEYLNSLAVVQSIYPAQAPQSADLPTLVIDNIGDSRDRHWASGVTSTGLVTSEFELTVWATTQVAALNAVNSISSSMDNLSGIWADTSTSPQTLHHICLVEVDDNGWQFNPIEDRYSASLFVSITHK